MIAASRKLLSGSAAVLLSAAVVGAGGLPEAVTNHPADAPAVAQEDTTTEVGWRLLAKLNYRTGEKTDSLAALDGKLVKIPGFTVPLEDWASSATEFLLVPYVGACIHTPPPPPNQLVYIEMDEGKRAKMDGWNPVWVEGVLKIEMTESVYGHVGFTITGQKVYPYES
ncbi:MAG: DUF3299 domain-containing protein [Gemmatimonadota bacterium]|nr:DUF3299 domain-containing protein [Gemmatimonadota bacterium]MDE2986199.1 DUF3299 domain-containing protein [Gemmatimonadota bacterium]